MKITTNSDCLTANDADELQFSRAATKTMKRYLKAVQSKVHKTLWWSLVDW